MRVRFDDGRAGSALFKSEESVVPLTELESWGMADQIEALRRRLGAVEIEPLPGLVIAEGPVSEGGFHRFRTALGETILDFSFLAEELPDGRHRVRLIAADELGEEIMDAGLLVRGTETVAVVAPLLDDVEALVAGVTPMPRRWHSPPPEIMKPGRDDLTDPVPLPDSRVLPVFPEAAVDAGLSGKVILEAVVRRNGALDGIVVLKMPEGGEHLAGAAVEAISQWRYEPATINGRPVPVYLTLVADFRLR